MNRSPRSVEELMQDNEALLERTEILQKRNKVLSFEVQNLQEIINQMEDDYQELQAKAERDRRIINGLKINNSALTLERNNLVEELNTIKSMSMFEFGNKYASSESLEADGHAFAKALLGKPMTEAEVEIDEAENAYVPYNGDDF